MAISLDDAFSLVSPYRSDSFIVPGSHGYFYVSLTTETRGTRSPVSAIVSLPGQRRNVWEYRFTESERREMNSWEQIAICRYVLLKYENTATQEIRTTLKEKFSWLQASTTSSAP